MADYKLAVNCSVGVMAYNEERNIARLLNALCQQELQKVVISEIVVVASGCTDDTVKIVENLSRQNSKIKLSIQPKREGKARAINLFIKNAKTDILVLESADTLPDEESIENLIKPFMDAKVGMTAAHILPLNRPDTFMGFYINLFWQLHHEIAIKFFKAGEMVAFRKVIDEIPFDTATDETSIAALIIKNGYELVYCPDSIVRNRGPENLKDFLKVRRRHLVGYYHLKKIWPDAYIPATMNNFLVLQLVLKDMKWNLKSVTWTFGAIFLEAFARLLALYDWHITRYNPYIWQVAESTKRL